MLPKRSTDSLITESTIELLRTRSVEQVTVRAIAENCGISTQTFYNHFSDKYHVIANIYTDTMSDYIMSGLNEWFQKKSELFIRDMEFFAHAFNYAGQNNLTSTLVAFDLQKYLLHIDSEIDPASVRMKLIRLGIISMIYGQFGLFESLQRGEMPLTALDFESDINDHTELMLLWAPRILADHLGLQPKCKYAFWDRELERIIVEF